MKILIPLIALLFCACPPAPSTTVDVVGDGGISKVQPLYPSDAPASTNLCAQALEALQRLHCPEATPPTPQRPFLDLCMSLHGTPYQIGEQCIVGAPTPAAVRLCNVSCAGQ